MAQNTDDIKWLYGKLKAQGYDIGSEDEFTQSLSNDDDRKWYYDKATKMGLDVGTQQDFDDLFSVGSQQPQSQTQPGNQSPTPAYPQNDVVPGWLKSAQTPMWYNKVADAARKRQETTASPTPNDKTSNNGVVEGSGVVRNDEMPTNTNMRYSGLDKDEPLTDEERQSMMDWSKDATRSNEQFNNWFGQQDRKLKTSDFGASKTAQWFGNDRTIKDASIYDMTNESMRLKAMRGQTNEGRLEGVNELQQSIDDQLEANAKKQEAAQTNRMYHNSTYGAGMDDESKAQLKDTAALMASKRLLQEAEDVIDAASNNGGGFWQAMGDKMSVKTWVPFVEGEDNAALLAALKKSDSGQKLTKAEETLLEASVYKMMVDFGCRDQLSGWYKAGETTGTSLPFMAEFMLNPMSGAGKGIASRLSQYALKKWGEKMLRSKALNIATKIGSRLAGDAVAAMAMTATTSAPGVATDYASRLADNYDLSRDNNGQIRAVKVGDLSEGEAMARAFATRYLENQSEMVFNAFAGGGQVLGKFIGSHAPNWAKRSWAAAAGWLGRRKPVEIINSIINDPTLRRYAERAQFHGMFGEYAEEVYNNFANVPLGEMTWQDAVSLKQNLETFYGLLPTSIAFGIIGIGGAVRTDYRLNKRINELYRGMDAANRARVDAVIANGRRVGHEEVMDYVNSVVFDKTMSAEDKRKHLEMAAQLASQSVAEQLEEDMTEEQKLSNEQYRRGREMAAQMGSNTDVYMAGKAYDNALAECSEDTRLIVDEAIHSRMGIDSFNEAIANLDADEQRKARTAYMEGAVTIGLTDAIEEQAQAEADGYAEMVGRFTTGEGKECKLTTADMTLPNETKPIRVFVAEVNGDKAVVWRGGKKEMVSTDKLSNISEIGYDDAVTEYTNRAKQAALDNLNMRLNHRPETQMPTKGLVLDREDGSQVMIGEQVGDNSYRVYSGQDTTDGFVQDGQSAIMSADEILKMQDSYYNNIEANEEATSTTGNEPTQMAHQLGEELQTADGGKLTINNVDSVNGTYTVETEDADGNTRVQSLTEAQLEAMLPKTEEETTTESPAGTTTETKAEAANTESPTTGTTEAAASTVTSTETTTTNEAQATNTQTAPTSGQAATANESALSRVPKDDKGNPIYEQTDTETAWNGIMEEAGGDEELAQAAVDSMVKDKEAALKAVEKAKAKGGATIKDKIASEQARLKAIEDAKKELEHWRKIAGVNAERKKADASQISDTDKNDIVWPEPTVGSSANTNATEVVDSSDETVEGETVDRGGNSSQPISSGGKVTDNSEETKSSEEKVEETEPTEANTEETTEEAKEEITPEQEASAADVEGNDENATSAEEKEPNAPSQEGSSRSGVEENTQTEEESSKDDTTTREHRSEGVRPLTDVERALRDEIVSLMRKNGLEVITDEKEGQRVLDWANGVRQQKVYHGSGAVRFFRTANGAAYGYTVGGKIYIDPRIATAETPIHEYAHLWASALKAENPKEWKNVVSLMKGTSIWDEVKERYPELKTDDAIADEVLAHYSGRRGAERLREEERKAKEEKDIFAMAEKLSAIDRLKRALDAFWKGVADFLHIHYTSAEEVADRVMKDLMDGVDPRKFGVDENASFQFVGEKGAKAADHAEEVTTRLDNLAVAREMEETKKDAKAIKMATGWERGADGKWRYEMPDFAVKDPEEWIKKKELKLSDVIDEDNDIFKAYPEAKDIVFKKGRSKSGGWYADGVIEAGLGDLRDALKYDSAKIIGIRKKLLRLTLLHEVQHYIQEKEGFAKGGNSDMIIDPSLKEELQSLSKEEDEIIAEFKALPESERRTYAAMSPRAAGLYRKWEDMEARIKSLKKKAKIGEDGYERLAGEVESRNVEERMGMTPEERRASLASETEDVAREDQIFLFGENGESLRELSPEELHERVRGYDESNGTELGRFVDFIERGRTLNEGEKPHFKVAVAGGLLQRYGINGNIFVSTRTINPNYHTSNIDHGLTTSEWLEAMESINNPLAITSYRNLQDNYRVYTYAIKNGKSICLGMEVKRNGNGVEISNVEEYTDIRTAFGRDIESALSNESILYPEGPNAAETIRRNFVQSSEGHNSLLYEQSPVSAANVGTNSESASIGEENSSNGKKYSTRGTESAERQPLSEKTRKACESVAEALGVDVEWVDHMEANGEFVTADEEGNPLKRPRIRLAMDAQNPLSTVFGHEGVHAVRNLTEEAYGNLLTAAKNVVGEAEWKKRFDATKARYEAQGHKLTDEEVEEEVVADIVGETMTDNNLAEDLAYRLDHSVLSALRDVARKIWDAIRRLVGGRKLTAEEQSVKDFVDTIERAFTIASGVSSEMDAANADAAGGRVFNLRTEEDVVGSLRGYLEAERDKKGSSVKWTDKQINDIINETEELIDLINSTLTGNALYDEWAKKDPTIRIDWRDGEEKPTVTWARNNIEYKYDASADLLCVNNEGIESTLSSPDMVELMIEINKSHKDGYTSADYMRLYETMRDLGLNVPCKGCFDAAMRFKMLPSVARKFVDEVNATIDRRNADPKKFDENLRKKAGNDAAVNGLPTSATTKTDAIAVAVAGDNLTEHISWTQLMSAEGQTQALADWGGIFRAWQKTGAGRPKDKLMPEPYTGILTHEVSTIIAPYGKKTPSFRDIEVNQGTGLRRNSHSEFRPLLAIDEIQFMRDAFFKNLCVFKYMKELDDVRLFGNLGVKFNMSFFPAFDKTSPVAGLDKSGNYIASEESVGSREYTYTDAKGKQHFDGMRGLQEAEKHINENVSLSSVVFSVPHLLKAFTDVPTPADKSGRWGSLIPFHASGADKTQLFKQGLGMVRGLRSGSFMEEAMTDYGKGVTNFEDVQNDRFGAGWTIVTGKKKGTAVKEGHKIEFANGNHYYNEGLGLHLFSSFYVYDKDISAETRDRLLDPNLEAEEKRKLKAEIRKAAGQDFVVDYNDKVRELGGGYAYKDAADYYLGMLPEIGLIPRFDFQVPEATFLKMCEDANVDPTHPKLGWKGEGNAWSPIDSPAYYSLFCDYGMTDPATGKWSPHRPVGYINENGEREFKLPDNAVDIVKEGVARYSEQRDKETAMHDEVMAEYVKRTVADGKLSQKQADAFMKKHGGKKFSLRSEENSSEEDLLFRTSDEIDAEYPNWLDGTTNDNGKHTTQIAGTVKTYEKVGGWIERNLGKDVKVLDASSGMGLGTQALREQGLNIEDVEPYQSEERKANNPATYSSYGDIQGRYDFIISNAVLNVIPDNWRRNVLHDMADRLKVGGRLFINTRKAGEEKNIKDKIELDSPQEVLVKRNGKIASYQRFFTPAELKEWVEEELGEGYSVEVANENNSGTKGLAAVVVTKTEDISNREGNGEVTDEELSLANDPISKALGQSRFSAKQRKEFADRERERMVNRVTELAEKLHLDNVEIVTDASTLTGQRAKAKGFFNPRTGKITIVVPNNYGTFDAEQTLLHEAVAHYGLRQLFGEHFDTFLDNVYKNAEKDVKGRIDALMEENGWDERKATEEYLASLAEDTEFENVNATWWSKVKEFFMDMLRNLGFENGKVGSLSDNELRYVLWRSYENLREPGKYSSLYSEAKDLQKQDELKVGQFTTEAENQQKVADLQTEIAEEEGVLFRRGGRSRGTTPIYDRTDVRGRYDARMSESSYQVQEALQDSMLSVKEYMNMVLDAEGSAEKMEDMDGFENPYIGENRLSSVNKAESDRFGKTLFKDLLKEVARFAKTKDDRAELTDYMFAKHGLERNDVMARRDAHKKAEDEIARAEKAAKAHPNDAALHKRWIDLIQNQKQREDDLYKKNRERDYAGLTALTGMKDVASAEAEARNMVAKYEASHKTDELWKRINAVSDAILKKSYESGMISRVTYDKLSLMYKNYIPLRGFDKKVAVDVYGYLTDTNGNGAFSSAIRNAKGRTSKADEPLAQLWLMMDRAISQGNRNVMVKQAMMNFAKNHPSNLITMSDLWIHYNAVSGTWEPILPNILPTDTPWEVADKIKDFESKMEQESQLHPNEYQRAKDAPDIPYRTLNGVEHEHQIIVRQNGKTYVMTVNGNPRLAQAINGLTNPDAVQGYIAKKRDALNRFLSVAYTSANPNFVLSNGIRDALYANLITLPKEGGAYSARFTYNWGKVNPARMTQLYHKYQNGTLNRNNYIEDMFYKFIVNGGETGFLKLDELRTKKQKIANELAKMNGQYKVSVMREALGDIFDTVNRGVENTARFAAFLTSMESGRSLSRSIYDAKEITVNFNKKGAGGKTFGLQGQTWAGNLAALVGSIGRGGYVFWNAAIQGTTNFLKVTKKNPAGVISGLATMFAFGILAAMIGGDDDEDGGTGYFDQAEATRRSNAMFKLTKDTFIKIPLPVELRAVYGLGELVGTCAFSGREIDPMEVTKAAAGELTQLLPLDFMEGTGGIKAVIPSALKPLWEAAINESWTGMPIYNNSDYNRNAPEWTKSYKSTNKDLAAVSKWLNEVTGGNDVKKGESDKNLQIFELGDAPGLNLANPAQVEHILKGYFGGYFTIVDQLKKTGEMIVGDRDFQASNIPLVNRVVQTGDERTKSRSAVNEYYKYKEKAEETKRLLRGYEGKAKQGLTDYAEYMQLLMESPDYIEMIKFDAMNKAIEEMQEATKVVTDEEQLKELDKAIRDGKKRIVEEMKKPIKTDDEEEGEKR